MGFILAAVAVAVGLQVPYSEPATVKYTALAPAENLSSQVANPISFILPALTGLILALAIYLVAKRIRYFKSLSEDSDKMNSLCIE